MSKASKHFYQHFKQSMEFMTDMVIDDKDVIHIILKYPEGTTIKNMNLTTT